MTERSREPVDATAWAARRTGQAADAPLRQISPWTRKPDGSTPPKEATLAERARNAGEYGPQTPYPSGRSLKQMNEDFWPKGGSDPSDWRQDRETGNWKPSFDGRVQTPQERRLPEPGTPGARSGRFANPRMMEVRARPAAEPAAGGRAGGGGGGFGGSVTQHFHGGFDEQTVARRAKLEQNRSIRQSQARALHSIGRLS